MICGRPLVEYRKKDKHVQILYYIKRVIKNPIFWELVDDIDKAEFWHRKIQQLGLPVGNFLAYQIMLDWNYYLQRCGKFLKDMNTFVDVGPGAKPGIEYIFDGDTTLPEEKCRQLYQMQCEYLGWKKRISLSDIENMCCEFRKYINLKKGIGKRRYYKP